MKIEEAIKSIVSELIVKKESFTAHDITNHLRDAVNSEVLKLDDAQEVQGQDDLGNTVKTQFIDHAAVKQIVHSMFPLEMIGYGKEYKSDHILYSYIN